jgi:hypothetical protein
MHVWRGVRLMMTVPIVGLEAPPMVVLVLVRVVAHRLLVPVGQLEHAAPRPGHARQQEHHREQRTEDDVDPGSHHEDEYTSGAGGLNVATPGNPRTPVLAACTKHHITFTRLQPPAGRVGWVIRNPRRLL